jgi:hypothetical protein
VLIYNLELRLFYNKLKSQWYSSYDVTKVYPHGAVKPIARKESNFQCAWTPGEALHEDGYLV